MADEITTYFDEVQAGRKGEPIGPSSVGRCYRQMAYSAGYFDVPPSNEISAAAANVGSLIHMGVAAIVSSMDRPGHIDSEVRIQIPGLPRAGTADIVDWDHCIVTDIKSVNGRAFQAMVNRDAPYASYLKQLELYSYGLWALDETRTWTMRILLVDRDTGARHEFLREADPDVGQQLARILAQRHECLTVSVQTGGSPEDFPREGLGPDTGMPCDWCPWMDTCWGTPSEEGMTVQAASIRADGAAIESWARSYSWAAADEAQAKELKQAAAKHLIGHSGTFGDYKVTTVGGKERGETVDVQAAADLLERQGLPVPTRSLGKTAKYVRVNRIPNAS